jgi:hypothetical protein
VHEETGLVLMSKHLQKHSHKGSNFDLLVIAAKVTAEEFALKRKISSTAYRNRTTRLISCGEKNVLDPARLQTPYLLCGWFSRPWHLVSNQKVPTGPSRP